MEKLSESIESSRVFSHRARMPGEFDSRKDSQSTKFERRPPCEDRYLLILIAKNATENELQ